VAQKLWRNKVLQSGIYISKKFHENKDNERSSHPKMNSSKENTEKVWNLVIQTSQDIHQTYYVEIMKFCETVHKKSLNSYPKTCSSIMKMLQLMKHSLSKVFMAKHLVMDLKTSIHKITSPLTFGSLQNWNPHWKDKDFRTLKPLQECDYSNTEGYFKRWVS
jgi:hypothetical protein